MSSLWVTCTTGKPRLDISSRRGGPRKLGTPGRSTHLGAPVLTSMLYASRPDVNGDRLMNAIRRFLDDTRGAVLVEYSVVVGAVGIVSMLTFVALGIALANDFR